MKFFVSCIIPRVRKVGIMQFEAASEEEAKAKAEKLTPCRGSFRAYEIGEFEPDLPVGEFIDSKRAESLGY